MNCDITTTAADQAKTARSLAAHYRTYGFNLVPLGADKRPVATGITKSGAIMRFRWEDWQTEVQTDARWRDLKAPSWWADVRGIAAVCGPISGDLACIDFDQIDESVLVAFLTAAGFPAAYPWTVRTPGGGWHVWLRCPGLALDKGKLDRPGIEGGHIELRHTGHYVVLPGSLHPSGRRYEWRGAAPVEGPDAIDTDRLLAAYSAVTVTEAPKAAPAQRTSTPADASLSAYALAALNDEVDKLRNAANGTRNNTANNAAFALGQLAGAGLLTENEIEQALLPAALAAGLDEGEALHTIRSGIDAGTRQPRQVEPRTHGGGQVDAYEYGFVVETPDPAGLLEEHTAEELADAAATEGKPRHRSWPYMAYKGRMIFLKLNEKTEEIIESPIADFTATIAEEIVDESGDVHLVIEGKGLRRGPFRCEISGADFGSDAKLLAALTEATGGIDVVYNRMSPHLRPAIGKLTQEGDRPRRTRYYRTGWQDDTFDTFLMPGMDDSTLISVPRQIAYEAPAASANLTSGLLALTHLIDSMRPEITAPVIAALFMPPMLRPAALGNERVAIFIAGRTGSLKTSWAQTALCLYGPGFISNDNLLKMGEGATRNAIMAFAAHAHDMPLLIDNYKPNTGNGKHDFVNLIHNILEGGDRKRSERSGALRDSKLIRCIPIVTGEDLPRDDAASIARILLVTFDWQRGEANDLLTAAQELSEHLCTVGWTWLQWLRTPAGRDATKAAAKTFPKLRSDWAARLSRIEKDSANIARVASNLAVNQLAWALACEHPDIGPAIRSYSEAHARGLADIARTMAKSTVEALEAHQYRAALRELLSSGQYELLARSPVKTVEHNRDRMLGWFDDNGVYLLPAIALAAVKKLLGPNQLLISPQTLYGQMQQLGWVADGGKESTTKMVSIGGEKVRVLHLKPAFTENDDAQTDGPEAIDALTETGL